MTVVGLHARKGAPHGVGGKTGSWASEIPAPRFANSLVLGESLNFTGDRFSHQKNEARML